jgi:hypothetical protein
MLCPNFKKEHLAEVAIVGNPTVSRYDSRWLPKIRNGQAEHIRNYLSGMPMTREPRWEILVEGRGFVLGTEVRMLAYKTVKEKWPESLGMLELSRVAVELGSDFGLSCAFLSVSGDKAQLSIKLNFNDARKPEFLEKLGKYKGPKNTADLNSSVSLILPDLRDQFVEFTI